MAGVKPIVTRGAGGGVLNNAINVLDAGNTIIQRRKDHPDEPMAKSLAIGAAKWGVQEVMWNTMSPLMWAKFAGDMAYGLGTAGYQMYKQGPSSRNYNPNFGGSYIDTGMNATMRQRGVMAIQNSRMNARSVLGNEARSLHQGRTY